MEEKMYPFGQFPIVYLKILKWDFGYSGETLDVFTHEEAVYGLSVDPVNDNVFASACDDGRILIYDIRAPAGDGKG